MGTYDVSEILGILDPHVRISRNLSVLVLPQKLGNS